MSDADIKRLAAAGAAGFRPPEEGRSGYTCTEEQLIAFAKTCEAAGRAQIALALRAVVNKGAASPAVNNALTIAADIADGLRRWGDEHQTGQSPVRSRCLFRI